MQIYELRFCQRTALNRAFWDVRDCSFVEDCLVDICTLKLRFRSRVEPAARQLFDRLKLEGGAPVSPLTPVG